MGTQLEEIFLFSQFLEEDKILREMKSNLVVGYYGNYVHDGTLCLVMERGKYSLSDLLHKNTNSIEDQLSLAIQVTSAVAVLHNRKPSFIHRDIKPSNFLIMKDDKIKLGDLGSAKSLADLPNTLVCTPVYAAPEMLASTGDTIQSVSLDVYSLGLVLWEIYHREFPIHAYRINEPPYPKTIEHPEHLAHRLVLKLFQKSYSCDVCKKRMEDQGLCHYRCDSCNYDVCLECQISKQSDEKAWPKSGCPPVNGNVPTAIRLIIEGCTLLFPTKRLTAAQALKSLQDLQTRKS